MPPVAARSINRTHLMAIAVATRFAAEHGELWEDHRDTIGVITAHLGRTRAMADYTIRLGATDLAQALQPDAAAF